MNLAPPQQLLLSHCKLDFKSDVVLKKSEKDNYICLSMTCYYTFRNNLFLYSCLLLCNFCVSYSFSWINKQISYNLNFCASQSVVFKCFGLFVSVFQRLMGVESRGHSPVIHFSLFECPSCSLFNSFSSSTSSSFLHFRTDDSGGVRSWCGEAHKQVIIL